MFIHTVALAAAAPAAKPVGLGASLTVGAAFAIIAVFSQWLVKKRARDKGVAKVLLWCGWVFAALGGEALSRELPNTIGVSSLGAVVVSLAMLGLIIVDVKDGRPDWPAMLCVLAAPFFMRLAGGTAGQLFDTILNIIAALNQSIAGPFFGG